MMIVLIAQITGLTDVGALAAIFAVNAAMILFGWLQEVYEQPGGGFLRTNAPAEDRWHSRDVAAIAAARGLTPVAPYFVDADATPNPGGFPVGGLTVVRFSDNHLVYAATWFALAAMLAGALGFVLRHEFRLRRAREQAH